MGFALAAADLLSPADGLGLAKLGMALGGSDFRTLAPAATVVMGDVVSVRGLACGGGPVMSMVAGGSLTRVFVRPGRARVMGGVTVMDTLAIVGDAEEPLSSAKSMMDAERGLR